jgi:predicted O-methyltransferase YrrM
MAPPAPAPGDSHEVDPRWRDVDHYSFAHLHSASSSAAIPPTSALEHALSNSKAKGLPDIAVSPSQGKFLKLQAQFAKAKNILEVGTLGGYSTIWLASAGPDVRVVSVEVDAHHAEVARANIAHADLSERVEVRDGTGLDVLAALAEDVKQSRKEKFDMVFIDADKENNWKYVDMAVGMTNKGGIIIVDNVVRKGQLALADTGNPKIEGARLVVEKVGQDERLDGVVMQTVGEKNYDGFLIAIVK